jgi:hypothetical protein
MSSAQNVSTQRALSVNQNDSLPQEFEEPLKELADDLHRISAANYVGKLKEAIHLLRKNAREEIRETMRNELDVQFRTAMEAVREQFQDRLNQTKAEFENEKQRFAKELDDFRRRDRREKLQSELTRTAQALRDVGTEIAEMLEDPNIELAKVIRQNAAQNEMKAYARGLSYQLDPDLEVEK